VVQAFSGFQRDLSLLLIPDLNLSQSAISGVWVWLGAVWLAGVLVLSGNEAYRIMRFAGYVDSSAREVSPAEAKILFDNTALNTKQPVVYLKGIESPAIYGLFRPVLLLPEGFLSTFDADQRHIILSHEAVHLQRRDNLWNMAACLIKILFWFNPLGYLAHHFYRLDQEVSCDALALTRCNENQTRQYARTLLASVAQAKVIQHPPVIAAWENPRLLKERIQMITQHLRKNGRSTFAAVCLLVVFSAGAGLTACAANNQSTQVSSMDTAQVQRPAPARNAVRNDEVLSRRVFSLVNEVIQLRDTGNYGAAMDKLSELKTLDDAGRLNAREQFVMWQFYANLYQVQGESQEVIDTYERILALPGLTPEQREDVQEQLLIVQTGGPTTANEIQLGNVEMLPIVTIQPNYPNSALVGDIEGWILVGFTVDESGNVISPQVIDAEPEEVFNDSALAAIAKFKFNPRVIDGEPVAVPGVRYLFRYSL
jgi:TonB family protein